MTEAPVTAPKATATRSRDAVSRPRRRRAVTNLTGYLLIAPAFLTLFAVIGYPLVKAVSMSLHKIILIKPHLGQPFVGLENYRTVIEAPFFWNAVWQTGVWTGVNVIAQLLLGLAIALLLNNDFPGRGLARGFMLIPWITPSVVAVLTWKWMYDAQFGIINQFLLKFGLLERTVAWLGNVETAMGAVIIESIWKGTPFVFVMLLAGLQAVPGELYDSAKVDGANGWRRFRFITLPLLKPTILIAATLTTIYTFNNFPAIWLMTEGGPLRSTETLTILVYKHAFQAFNFGEASAIGVITFLVLLVFVILFGREYVRSQMKTS